MPAFKFDSATVFLTYPHSDLSHDAVIEHLRTIGDVVWARVCTEQHKDGEPHIHVVCKFAKRVQSRNARLFDIGERHPNIQPVRSVKRSLEYVSKDGQFTDYGTIPGGPPEDCDWLELAKVSSEAQYYMECNKRGLSFMYAKKFWELGSKTATCEIAADYEGDISRESFELQIYLPVPGKSIVVIGPSGCGKSSWAKRVSAKPALWVRHLDVLRSFRAGYHKSIIFDDMSFQHMPREAQIHLVDQTDEAHIHCRYGYAIIPAGTQKIFTANSYPFIIDPAIERRVYKIEVMGIFN